MDKTSNDTLLQKTFSIITFMSDQDDSSTIRQISESLNIANATVHRILNKLKDMEYVGQLPDKNYYLTYKLFEVSGKIMKQNKFIDKMIPIMNYFAMKYKCDMGLSVFNQKSVVNLMTVGSNVSFGSALLTPGSIQPAYCTAAGKVFLTQLTSAELQDWLEVQHLVPYTSETIIDPRILKEQVVLTKDRGYGLAISEYTENLACMSIPIVDSFKRIIGTLNFSATSEDIKKLICDNLISEANSMIATVFK